MAYDPGMHDGCEGCSEFKEWTRRRFFKEHGCRGRRVRKCAGLDAQNRSSSRPYEQRYARCRLPARRDGRPDDGRSIRRFESVCSRPSTESRGHAPGETDGAVDLDGFFGLAPSMAPLLPAFQSGQLAIVHATGSPDPTRSHFDANSYWSTGIPLQPINTFTGWLTRHLEGVAPTGDGLLRGIALADRIPKTLADAPATLPVPYPSVFGFPGNPQTESQRRAALETVYASAMSPLDSVAEGTVDTIDLLESVDWNNYQPDNFAVYPNNYFGVSMRNTAALIKAELGVETAMLELGGWDTHNQQGVFNGGMANLMNTLSQTLAAFHSDMQDYMDHITVLVMSEFGRRADENGSLGTDHGHGNCMFVMGGNIAGGQVMADWTSNELLHPDLLYGGDSLAITIDYRDIVAEIVENRLGNSDIATVFPDFTPTYRGITV